MLNWLLDKTYIHAPWALSWLSAPLLIFTATHWADWTDHGSDGISRTHESVAIVCFVGFIVDISAILFTNPWVIDYRRRAKRIKNARFTRFRSRAAVPQVSGDHVTVVLYERRGMFAAPEHVNSCRFNAVTESSDAIEYAERFVRPDSVEHSPDALALARNIKKV